MANELADLIDEYEKLGIFPDTWTCVAIMDEPDMKTYVVALAQSGTPCKVSTDLADPTHFHIAIQGGLKSNPAAVFITYRGGPIGPTTCKGRGRGQHPMDAE